MAAVELVEPAELEDAGVTEQEAGLDDVDLVKEGVVLNGELLKGVADEEESVDGVGHAVEVDDGEAHLEALANEFVHAGYPEEVGAKKFVLVEVHHLVAVEGDIDFISLHELEGPEFLDVVQVGVE